MLLIDVMSGRVVQNDGQAASVRIVHHFPGSAGRSACPKLSNGGNPSQNAEAIFDGLLLSARGGVFLDPEVYGVDEQVELPRESLFLGAAGTRIEASGPA